MDLDKAKNLAIDLMFTHGLLDKGWYFEFDNSVRRFGCCNYRLEKISLSKKLVALNSEERVKNTILHEIAHALVGRGHGHGAVWKKKAIEIGCDGKRCFSYEEVTIPQGKYQATCKKCGFVHHRQRKPKKSSSCGICNKKFDKDNLLEFYFEKK